MNDDKTVAASSVFIVDDNPANTKMLEQVLEAEGFACISVFHDPQQALLCYSNSKPDILLLDLIMPGLSGIEFLKNINHDIRKAEVSVIVLTASHDDSLRIEALSLGALDYIEKPFNIIETLQRIRNIDKRHQRKKSLEKLSVALDKRLDQTRKALSDVLLTLSAIYEHSSDYMFITHESGEIIDLNMAAQKRFKIGLNEGKNLFVQVDAQSPEAILGQREYHFLDNNDQQVYIETNSSKVEIKGDVHWIFIFKDITTRKQDEIALRFMTETHYLTHLPNRHQLVPLVDKKCLPMNDDASLSFIFLAFFGNAKEAELYGHEKMERLLFNIALTLVDLSSEFGSVVIHWGDNDFLMVESSLHATRLLELTRKRFEQAINLVEGSDVSLYCKPTIGLYESGPVAQLQSDHYDTLVHNALLATYEGARLDRTLTVFDEQLMDKIQYQARISKELVKAVENNEFRVAYQPKIDLQSQKIIGVEALIRWYHPELGMVGPDIFIPIAHSNGLINEVGTMVLHKVVSELPQLKAKYLDIRQVAINVAAPQLDSHFVELLNSLCKACPELNQLLELEITETSFLDDFERVNPILQELKSMGFRLAIDDFGTGYSSLSYLHELPIDTLKIDRSFVIPILTSQKSLLMVKSIVSMSLALGLEIVAEGIEDEATGKLLQQLGVQIGQGYYFYQPEFLS